MRNSYAQAPEDHRSRLEKIFTEELANGGERLLLGALLDAVPAGPQEMTPPGSPRMALEGFITEWIQDDVSMLDPNEPSARKPTGVFKGGGVDEEGDGEGVTGWEDDAQPNGAGGSPSPELRRQARRMSLDLHVNRPTRASLPDPVDNGPAAGAFTQIEKAATDDVLEYICQTYDLDSDEIRGNMIDWTNLLPELKVELKNALPNRTTAAIRKFCQRRYFPKTSGPWTKEEDEMLLRAHAEHGDRWMSVSDLVGGRTGQQCRDRYRDHLQYGEEKETGPWSQDEEAKLVRVVSECVEQIRQANIDKGDLVNEVEELEKLVAWNVVSDKFGGQRSRKRCMEKWQQLRRKNPDVLDALKDNHPPARVVTALPFDGHSRRQRKVVARYHSFQTGDIYDVLVEIYTAITDHAKIWSEETTFWSIVGQKNTGSRFNGALRRKAYQEALGTYEGKNAVRAAATIAGKAKAMAEWLELHREKHGAEFTRGYRPKPRVKKVELTKVEEGGNEGNGAPARMRQRARGRMNSARNVEEENCAEVEDALAREPRSVRLPKRKKVHLSAEMVENSDEEEDASDRKMGSDAGVEDEDAGGQDAPEPQSGGDASDEDVYNVPSDDPPAYDTVFKPEVPDETQGQPEVTGSAERTVDASDDALSMSSLNSRYRRNVSRPSLGRQEFLARCRETGRRQHAEALENGLGWARRGRG
ncbi:hypothetical protein B0A55_00864 [Friedmanniomyces simplex]|uniref:Uncharacterized protein n=1 Tax=Friedmanniomyces simplex TaxID=329884 RepID=A0A4U0XZ30_9PEZI|nr:hypothetical protein B0A55_00864 [Friedmanniomyces simplex]